MASNEPRCTNLSALPAGEVPLRMSPVGDPVGAPLGGAAPQRFPGVYAFKSPTGSLTDGQAQRAGGVTVPAKICVNLRDVTTYRLLANCPSLLLYGAIRTIMTTLANHAFVKMNGLGNEI